MADDKNAAVNMAMLAGGMYGPNPYSKFPQGIQDTSYNTYGGGPTDALGRPIQPMPGTPGMTLNQTPAQPQAAPAQSTTPGMYGAPSASELAIRFPGPNATPQQQAQAAQANAAQQARINPGPSAYYSQGASNSLGGNQYDSARIPMTPFAQAPTGPQGQQQTAPQSTAAAAPNSYQNALNLLSNPGKVTTQGANVPQNPSINNQPSVLDQFLQGGANQGGTGAGGYSNTGFFDTLNKLKGMSA